MQRNSLLKEEQIKQEKQENVDFIYRGYDSNVNQTSQTGTSKSLLERTINGKIYGVEADLNPYRPIKQETENENRNVCICQAKSFMSKP